MSCESQEAPFFPCHKDSRAEYLADGTDSVVYRLNELVVKRYYPHKVRYENSYSSALENYYQVTNLASEFAKTEKIEFTPPFSKHPIPIEINPIMSIHKCSNCGCTEGVSKFIHGDGLNLVYRHQSKSEIYKFFLSLSRRLDEELGFKGINILLMNAKLTDYSENARVVITDLCGDIRVLQKTDKKFKQLML